jgi:hypothetical protein
MILQQEKVREIEYKKIFNTSNEIHEKQINEFIILLEELRLENIFLRDKLKYIEGKMLKEENSYLT